ncbi:ft [Drosophila busckii]|uniref:Protocadherin-16 n=1 Tax=Drosophila busckii TaxID=30019 RepID=A0A0M4E2E8_DROBS|nr:ft [Drosophila busckii]
MLDHPSMMRSLPTPRAAAKAARWRQLMQLLLLLLATSATLMCAAATELAAPRGRSYATTYEQYAAFPRRRSSSPAGEMQSRAVDTSADFEVLEGQPRGTLVGYIPTKPKFTYRFNEPPREFTLDQITGEIKTNMVLDREGMRSHYDLVVLSSQPTYPIEVRIKVLDINDNAPQFPEPSIAVTFSESAVAGTRLLLDAATDADTGENGISDHYEIVAGNVDSKFRLATTTNPAGDTSYLHLETTGNLDRENCGYYQLNISASDGGTPARLGYLQVNVSILDVNDNPPIFDHSDYSVILNETVKPGTPVLQVMASDNDLGDNSKLTYYLAESEQQFTVDPETGVISTTEQLTCPQQQGKAQGQRSCVFTVFARDHGSPRQDGRTYVTVNLLDTNDHDPAISFQYFPPTGNVATVDENASNGTVVAAVSVKDSDVGPNGETTTRIIAGNELGHFRLEKTQFLHIVRVNGVLDREEINKYNLTVVAMDKGTPARTAIAYLIIDVNDVNDHEPVFEKSEYAVVLSELTPQGSFVASITATDEDTGVNAQVHYEILSGNELQWFSIDASTGLIVTRSSLDREQQASVELSISAHDGGPNPKYAYTQLKLTILDENDEAPQFVQQVLNVTLREDAKAPALVALLSATDNDQGTNGSVSYSLAPAVERLYPQQFSVDAITGQLMTRLSLDRETMANYEVYVIARDQGAPAPQSATATVYLSIGDVNDNSPVFYPRHYIYTATAAELKLGSALLNVTATDQDAGDNALISYKLQPGAAEHFQLHPQTGALSLKSRPLQPYYQLRVQATDAGGRSAAQDAIVELLLLLQDKAEQLHCSSYNFHIAEDHAQAAYAPREVGRVGQSLPALEYLIIAGDPLLNFAIDSRSGLISTARRLDRELQSHFELTVLARSGGGGGASARFVYAKCQVHITVSDLNDNAPIFVQDRSTDAPIWLAENTAVGQEIFLTRARDRDAGVNSHISYKLIHNPGEQFRINAATGVLYLQQPIRSEPGTVLNVELQALDGGMPQLSSRLSLSIYIADVNDHTPVFDHTSYETSLLETTKLNTRFFALAASDSDLAQNARISYEIIAGNAAGMFGVFPDGYLYVRALLDREQRDYYALTVACRDAGSPARSSVVPVVIHVIDENDNAPQFSNSTFTFSIPENSPADTFVGKLTALDKDIGRNAELSFSVSSPSLDFLIDTHNGFIKTLRSFDREALVARNASGNGENYLLLEATVRDNGVPSLQDKVKVKIIITDVNDNAPEFLRAPYAVTINEGAAVGTHILHVFTQDADEGLNGDVFYTLTAGNEAKLFHLDSATGQLSLARKLDRETQSLHQLQVVARDAALKSPLSATSSISITVQDDNDNAPEFTQTSSEISILETSAVGTELMRFRASDADQGINAQVVFSITAGNRRDTFHIDSISGSLYLHKSLDFEDVTHYTLNITAADCGTPSLSTTVLYQVIVVDDNDNAPSFPSTAIVRQIKEGIALKTPIVTVTADDPDAGLNGKVTYSIRRQEPELMGGLHFGINTQSGVIYTLREIDRESIDNFRLTIVATDQAQPASRQLSTEKLVTVIVEDINDNAPIFVSMNAAVLPAPSNASRALQVMRVLARDADSSSNGLVTYEIVSGNQELFRLQRNTGVITLTPQFQLQSKQEVRYQLALKATDEASGERKSSETYITLITPGLCDEAPRFEQHNALFGAVYENEPIGTSILTVIAQLDAAEIEYYVSNVTSSRSAGHNSSEQVDRLFDIDAKLGILSTAVELDHQGINAQVVFSITAGNRRDTFHIDSISGSLYLHKSLDFEDVTHYTLNITAADCGTPSLSTTVLYQVIVVDDNDNAPSFPSTAIVRQIKEGIALKTPIVTVTADDPDAGLNGKVTYSIRRQEPELMGGLHFGINTQSGVIYTLREIDRESIDNFRLTIVATDQAQPASRQLSTEKLVTVIVEDINDNAPIFVSMNAAVLPAPSNASRALQVMRVLARDADSSSNGLVTYEIVSGNQELFRLQRNTGVITLTPQFQLQSKQEVRYQLALKATDEASGERKSSETYITLITPGLCDEAPRFEQHNALFGAVYENEPIGTSILTVIAQLDAAEIEYYVSNVTSSRSAGHNSSEQVDRLFDIDAKLGILSTAVELDREAGPPNYEVDVYAVALGGKPRTAHTKIKVTIMDKNDSPPKFLDMPLVFNVSEDLEIGHTVTTIRATDPDPDIMSTMIFSLIDGHDGKFLLEPTSGRLQLKDTLDRETKAKYDMRIRVSDGVQYTETNVIINVDDTNDNAPVFEETVYSFDIPENAPRGYQVGEVVAKDADLNQNAQVSYAVLSDWGNDVFSLNPQTGMLTLTGRLDYEEVQHYILIVQAQDNGQPSLSNTIVVYCNVIDLNDNTPLFDPMSYSSDVYENVPIGTEVVTVSAKDIDSGNNGRIEYSITGGDLANEFEIHSNGSINTRRQLDRESRAFYALTITARDCADEISTYSELELKQLKTETRTPRRYRSQQQNQFLATQKQQRLSSTVQVIISIRDVNDEAPVFVSANETAIMENVAINTVVFTVKAIDNDDGYNGYIEYILNGQDEQQQSYSALPFTLNPTDGVLRVAAALDRELQSSYSLNITARDRGMPPLVSATQLKIKVMDENDNMPVFDPKQYSAAVAENASIGAMVLQVSATDMDEGDNGRVRYSIVAGDQNRDFSISEDTGIVRVDKNLNYERKARYVLTVKAEDCALQAQASDTAELIINILDINDNRPTFLDSPYIARVMENTLPPNEGYVLTVKAYDADTPPLNSQVRYFLKEGNADLFRINASTGEIVLLRALDREQQSEYILTLVAMDQGSPPLSNTGIVRVEVQDLNDNEPKFELQAYQALVMEQLPVGTLVLQPVCRDADAGLNAKLRYSLLGAHRSHFVIDADTGEISTALMLDREQLARYELTLMAQDSSITEPRASSVNLTILVGDINDNAPRFDASSYSIVLPDNIRVGEFVFGAQAQDADEGKNSQLSYKLSGHDADQGAQPLSAKASLTLQFRAASLFPVFAYMPQLQFTLPEDVPVGKAIVKLSASSAKKSGISYQIVGGNLGNAAVVDAASGLVSVGAAGLDYELTQQFELWLAALDADNPSLRTVTQLLINVTDVNDNAPQLQQLIYQAQIFEEEPPPQLVVAVKATDADAGSNAELSYRLRHDYEGSFEIDEHGEIYTTQRLDREQLDSYALVVEALDQGVPQLTGSATVLLQLLDKNDNPPKFTRLYALNVSESAQVGSFVIRVTSSDLDLAENANASYSFSENPGEKFSIEAQSGNISVAGQLDREQQEEYLLKVVATDGAWRAETPITISIQDENDNAPEFEHSFYSFNFAELQPKAVAFVGQLLATDRDKQGPNSLISYALQTPSPVFSVDPATGNIYSKTRLKYKHSRLSSSPENMFAFTVLATDNGKPPLYSECLVQINIVDANNNAPQFAQSRFIAALPAQATAGQRLIQVHAVDELDVGVNAELLYSLVGSNASAHFSINKHDGWLSLAQRVDLPLYEELELRVLATDRGVPAQSAETRVRVVVTPENAHAPQFSAASNQVIVPENEPVGSTIITVSATDKDRGPNGMLLYSFAGGNERGDFAINAESGAISILQPLDYDTLQDYQLNISVRDLGYKPRSAQALLTIILTDVNDNPPLFNQTNYVAYIEENKPPGSFVYQAHATDKDSLKNAVIQYALLPSAEDQQLFSINASSGAIYAAASFDYEQRRVYNLQLRARNPDSTMESFAALQVQVLGVNEFYPQFVQPVFHFDVSESSAPGTAVGSVQATDKDSGADGEIYYLLVGASNDKGFGIDAHSGQLRVVRSLDRETQNRVALMVLAKNYGSIRGNDTDEAQVIISIQDGNDAPEFVQRLYFASITEDAAVGTLVTQVRAVDKDVRVQNNQFSYSIINGNLAQRFKIDAQSGEIITAAALDREQMSHYELTIGAIDTGLPPQTGSCQVRISIEDINDNAPAFAPEDLLGYINENAPAGSSIMQLKPQDADLPPNGAPFSFELLGGQHSSWVSLHRQSGVLSALRSYDRESNPQLELLIAVSDSGKPPLTSQHKLRIQVLDQNDNPSTPRELQLLLHSFDAALPAHIKLADVRPNDVDQLGDYSCRFAAPQQQQQALSLSNGCELFAQAASVPSSFNYQLLGNDGKHEDVSYKLQVNFQLLRNDSLQHTVSMLISNISAAQFLSQHFVPMQQLLNSRLQPKAKLSIYTLLESPSHNDTRTNVQALLLASTPSGALLSSQQLLQLLQQQRAALANLLPHELTLGYDPCSAGDVCLNGAQCSASLQLLPTHSLRIVDSPKLILTAPHIEHQLNCQCAAGFAGAQCSRRQDPCQPNPCQAQTQCRRLGLDYQCECPPHREGKHCQLTRSDVCWTKPCRNGGSCQRSPDGASYYCLCRPGFRGSQCESAADSCRPNPCQHGGHCLALQPGYKCSCPAGRFGRHCERLSYGFEPLSFMSFGTLDATTNDISIVFASTKPTALLAYNYGLPSGGRSDFLAIELVRGQAYFSTGGARSAITSLVAGRNLADGSWHKVTATRNGRVMSLSVAECTDSGDVCAECAPNDPNCYADDFGPVATLNFNKQPLLIGGLPSADAALERPGQIQSDDLVGCVHSVTINGRALNLSAPLQQQGILPGCRRQACEPALAAERCGNYAEQCVDRWSTALCQCGGQLQAPNCGAALEAMTLGAGGFLEFKLTAQHRRMQLLDGLYKGQSAWSSSSFNSSLGAPKQLSLMFRTLKPQGLLLYAATNQMYTSLTLQAGQLVYYSKQQLSINMTLSTANQLNDGAWHNLSLQSQSRALHLLIDGQRVGDELDAAGVHDFLDPYLTQLSVGGAHDSSLAVDSFVGCIANFSINNELQPLTGNGSIFPQLLQHGEVSAGCSGAEMGIDAAQVADPLSIGITLVIVFFVILAVAIFGSYIIYRFRGKQEKIGSLSCGVPGFKLKHPAAAVSQSQADHVLTRNLHAGDAPAALVGNSEHLRPPPPAHHMNAPELLTKKFKERSELTPSAELAQPQQRPQRPDIIEREVVGKRGEEQHYLAMAPPNALHALDHAGSVDMGSEYPEHYDLENASSIAPSDIDIVYHYKGYREAGGMRKYKATTPPVNAYTHHKHAPFVPRVPAPNPNQSNQQQAPSSSSRTHQTTPLARLSPSSELSSQQPRILTLHDISGKPLQSALLATTSSSVGVGKDALHSNSERSLNSPVMSQLSGQSSSASRQKPVVPHAAPQQSSLGGLTAEEIERLNGRPRTCSLVSTLDLSSSSEAPRVSNGGLHMALGGDVDAHSSTSTDESGNDSFTCSEIEYDNNSLSGDGKYSTNKSLLDSRSPVARALSGEPGRNPSAVKTPPIPMHAYDGFDSSFRGSLSTLVASDDDLAHHLSGIYRKTAGAASPSATTLGWEYLLNWGPSYENLMGVFKDIAELPDSAQQQQQQQQHHQQQQSSQQSVSTLRIPNVQKATEEYV